MLQTPEIAAERIQSWVRKHPSVAETDQNIAILTKFIATHFSVAGECVIDEAFLDLAYQSIGSALQHIAGPEIQQQIEQANQQAQALLAEKHARDAEAERQRKRIEHEQFLEQRQRNRTPGSASAYEGVEQVNAQRQREVSDRQKAHELAMQHAKFVTELTAANNHIETITGGGMIQWGKTNDARARLKDKLRRKYPQFKSDIK